MALQAVTDLKITQIRRSIGNAVNGDRSNCTFSSYTIEHASNKLHVFYQFDLEWINPNFDPHWTELTVTQSGLRRTFNTAHVNTVAQNWNAITSRPASANTSFTQAEANVIQQLLFGVGATTASYSYDYLKDHQNTAFTGGNATNKISGVFCRIYAMDGDYPQTVTITVKTKTISSSQTTTITRVMNISEGSVLEGPLIPTLSANGTIQSRNLDGFFRTESDSKSLTGALLGVGSSPVFGIVSPLYDSDGITTSAQVRAANMQQGKFYKLTNSVNYGLPLVFDYDKFIRAITSTYYDSNVYGLRSDLNVLSPAVVNSALFYANSLYQHLFVLDKRGSTTSSIDLQYLVIVPPEIEITTTAVVRTGLNQPFSYRVKKATGSAEFVTNATSFSLGTLPTGVTATINSDGVISGTMTVVGEYTITINASNSSGTSTGSVKFSCKGFSGVDKTITVESGQPISEVLAASSPATYSLVSSTAPTGAVSVIGGNTLKGNILINGTYSVVIRASETGTNPVVTDDLTYTVKVDGLAQPSSLFLANVRRVLSTDKRTLDYYGVLSWDFTEPKNHSVKVTVIDLETDQATSTVLPLNTKQSGQLKIGSWSADSTLDKKSFRLEVQLVGDYSSSPAGIFSYEVSQTMVGSVLGKLTYDDAGGLELPRVDMASPATNTITIGTVRFTANEGTPQISSVAPPPIDWSIARNVTSTAEKIPKTSLQNATGATAVYGLRDGGSYVAEITYRLAGALTIQSDNQNRRVWAEAANVAVVSASFEYYYRGLQPPTISSPLSVNANINRTFQYRISALGATSFDADFGNLEDFSVNVEDGLIEGVFTSEATQVIEISATNRKGTTIKLLTVNVRDFYAEPKTLRAVQNKAFTERLVSSYPATWQLLSGAPNGFTVTTDTNGNVFLSGTATSVGSFNVLLRATQTGYTPTRTVDVTYPLSVVSASFVDPNEQPTVIVVPANAKEYSTGKSLYVGDKISVAFSSEPPVAQWTAEGLPPSLKIDPDTGLLSGTLSGTGQFVAQVNAKAANRLISLPTMVAINVEPAVADKDKDNTSSALARAPWLASRWDMIDFHVYARKRTVEGSLMAGSVKFKIGDDCVFGVFFLDPDGKPFDLKPSRIRIAIRPKNNVDDPLLIETSENPTAIVYEETPYYELVSKRGVDWRAESLEVVEDWAVSQATATVASDAQAPLQCIGEIEWIKDGKSFSSETFKVELTLDVNR
jgi:hypothetical protein